MTSSDELEPIAYLRDLDGTGSLHPCGSDDPGSIPVYSADTIEAQAKKIRELTDELSACTETPGGCGYWKEAAKNKDGQIEELIGALEPFANYGEALGGQLISDMRVMAELWDNKIIVKDLKQAHTILAKHNKRGGCGE